MDFSSAVVSNLGLPTVSGSKLCHKQDVPKCTSSASDYANADYEYEYEGHHIHQRELIKSTNLTSLPVRTGSPTNCMAY